MLAHCPEQCYQIQYNVEIVTHAIRNQSHQHRKFSIIYVYAKLDTQIIMPTYQMDPQLALGIKLRQNHLIGTINDVFKLFQEKRRIKLLRLFVANSKYENDVSNQQDISASE